MALPPWNTRVQLAAALSDAVRSYQSCEAATYHRGLYACDWSLSLFHHGCLRAELRHADGAHAAARAGSDDDQIVGHCSRTACHGRPRVEPGISSVLSIQGTWPF